MLIDHQMQSDHAGTTQVDFEVDCPPPADSPPGDLLITMVKEKSVYSGQQEAEEHLIIIAP